MRQIFSGLILALFISALLASPALADTPDPDSPPSIDSVDVYHNLIEDDDMLVVAKYSIPYATTPDAGVDKAYIFSMLDSDNTTELGLVLAYPYFEKGYGDGVVSFYFSANASPSWGLSYPLIITQNPAEFDSPESWAFQISPSDYSSFDTQEENQQLLQDQVIALADELSTSWVVELLEQSETGTVLSAYGEAYFRNAIRGIQTMCPELFYVVVSAVDLSKRTWDYAFADYLVNTYNGTWVWTSMSGFAGLWGLETSAAMGYVVFVIGIVLFSVAAFKFQQVTPGYLFLAATLIWGSLNGWFSPIIHALVAFAHVLVGSIVLFLNRS